MPANQETTLNIVCDNSACPGNSLPTDERTGWVFVNAEKYGEPTLPQLVVCSAGCLETFSAAVAAADDLPLGEAWAAEQAKEPKATRRSKK